ncbi:hypothetical protein C8R44DRAFT_749490 [Mycena epipterygia]|nr:hypothetical protein C8R44DRAFT_749490 [Mycena epipterygia]
MSTLFALSWLACVLPNAVAIFDGLTRLHKDRRVAGCLCAQQLMRTQLLTVTDDRVPMAPATLDSRLITAGDLGHTNALSVLLARSLENLILLGLQMEDQQQTHLKNISLLKRSTRPNLVLQSNVLEAHPLERIANLRVWLSSLEPILWQTSLKVLRIISGLRFGI